MLETSIVPGVNQGATFPSWRVSFLAPPLLIALAGATCHSVALGTFSLALLFWSLLAGLVFLAVGLAFLSSLESRSSQTIGSSSSLSAYLAGFILVSSALLLLAFTSPVSIRINFGILSFAGFATLLSPNVRAGWKRLSFGKVEAFALTLVLISAGLWSQENLQSITVDLNRVVSHPWQDIPFHVTQISLFARSRAASQLSDPLMAGQPVPLYHYGSYMVASLLCSLTGIDAYSLTTGWYAPMAFVLTGLAAWSLGASLLGTAGGLGAVFGVLLIPDPSYYGLGNRWTSYFFFQSVEIGAAYAVAIMGLSWALFFRFLQTDTWRYLLAAILLCALSALFKATNFVTYSSGLLVFAAIFAKGIGRQTRIALLAGVLLAILLGVFALRQLPNSPTFSISSTGARWNLLVLLYNFPSSSLGWLRDYVQNDAGYLMLFLMGVPIILLTTYGLLGVACLAAVWASSRRGLDRAWTLFPILILANHIFVALCLSQNHGPGDKFEIIHKTFVFPYFAIAAWSAATLFSQFKNGPNGRGTRDLTIAFASIAALASVYQAGKTLQSSSVSAPKATNLAVPRGIYDAAQFIRQRTQTDEVVQFSENDERAILPALAERTVFIVRYAEPPFLIRAEETTRTGQIDTLLNLDQGDSVKSMAASLGIDWLLLGANRQPHWAAELSPEFESQGFRLYHFTTSGPAVKSIPGTDITS